jgi:hypothetical protein
VLIGSAIVLHICANIGPLLKYWVAPVGSAPVLCLCVNLLPAKYYVVPMGSTTVLHPYTQFCSLWNIMQCLYVVSLTLCLLQVRVALPKHNAFQS